MIKNIKTLSRDDEISKGCIEGAQHEIRRNERRRQAPGPARPKDIFHLLLFLFNDFSVFCRLGIRFRELKCSFAGMFSCRKLFIRFFAGCALAPASIDDDAKSFAKSILTSFFVLAVAEYA